MRVMQPSSDLHFACFFFCKYFLFQCSHSCDVGKDAMPRHKSSKFWIHCLSCHFIATRVHALSTFGIGAFGIRLGAIIMKGDNIMLVVSRRLHGESSG
jgi:hypothetical protein